MLFRFKCFNWCLRPANETRQCCKGNFFWGKVATKHMRAVIKIMLRTIPMGQMLWTAEELQRFHQGSKKYVRIILSNWLIMKIITKSHFGRIIHQNHHWHIFLKWKLLSLPQKDLQVLPYILHLCLFRCLGRPTLEPKLRALYQDGIFLVSFAFTPELTRENLYVNKPGERKR